MDRFSRRIVATGPTEEDAVLSIVHATWRKHRVQKFLEIRLIKNSFDPDHLSYDETSALAVFAAILRGNPEADFEEAGMGLKPVMLSSLGRKFPRAEFPSRAERAQAVIDDIEKQLLAKEQLRQFPGYGRFESMLLTAATYTDEVIDKELKLVERLDAMIDRAVKRLVQTKALKQVLGQTGTARTKDRSESGKVVKMPDRK